jgi:hypothetical protein
VIAYLPINTRSKLGTIWRLAAAAYAEAGQFEQAVKAAQNGLALAEAPGDSSLVQSLENNIRLFEEKTPLRDVGVNAPSRWI